MSGEWEAMFEPRYRQHAANCPHCGHSHHYSEVKFPAINDRGEWLVECSGCAGQFVIRLRNPMESQPKRFKVLERHDEDISAYAGNAPGAGASVVHNLDMNAQRLRFDYAAEPIYRCASSGHDLEAPALAALRADHAAVATLIDAAMNMYLAMSRLPPVENSIVRIPVACDCGEDHMALFYHPFRTDGSVSPTAEEMLLADISGTDLTDHLTGIFSKTFLMSALEKLIMRWRLLCDQVVIAAPFIGHQFKSSSEKLEIWEGLLEKLDPDRTVFLTRAKGYAEYKKALQESGLDHDLLARFGLQNKIVDAGTRKQDFHAKFYAGVGPRSEILSGSVNLVAGKSFENASFAECSSDRIKKRYLDPLGVMLSSAPLRPSHHIIVEMREGRWAWGIEAGYVPSI